MLPAPARRTIGAGSAAMRMLRRELLKFCAAATLAIATPILIVLAAYDVTGTSPPGPFATGAWSTHTPTATHTAATSTSTATSTASPTATHTATATPTSHPCGRAPDAKLEFRPSHIELLGPGPFNVDVRVKNKGSRSTARDVVLALSAPKSSRYIDEVELPDGMIWEVNGGEAGRLYAAGDIAPGGSITIPLVVRMTDEWGGTDPSGEAKIRIEVLSAGCLRHPPRARLTVEITCGGAGVTSPPAEREGTPAGAAADPELAIPTATATETPGAATSTATATATASPTETASATPTQTATPEPSPEAAAPE